MHTMFKGSISFGLVHIPIKLYAATEEKDIKMRYLHNKCHSPIKYEKMCPVCDEDVKQEEIVKGYEYEQGRFVIVEKDELEEIAVNRTKSIEIIGLYDQQGQLWYIGHAGTGKLTQRDWRSLTETIQGLRNQERPFVNLPRRNKDAIWIKPELTVKKKFMEWTKVKILRQPSFQSIVNADVKECTFEQVQSF